MLSVIVPAYNAERTIKDCIESLLNQDYKDKYEVIVVDDGSTDDTAQIMAKYPTVKFIKQSNAGPAAARNRGASEANGEIILFTDSDCVPERDWIRMMLEPFHENKDVVGVKGIYRTKQRELTARFVQMEYEDKYRYMEKEDFIDFIDTYSAGFRKEKFMEMKGYDTEFSVACAEDVELSYRLAKRGYKMIFNPRAIVYHKHPATITGYLKKKYKFAYWRVVAVQKNPEKVIKDSHTPQTMKIQVLFPPLLLGFAVLSMAYHGLSSIFYAVFLLFFATTLPFAIRSVQKDFVVGLLSPVFLFLRSFFQFLGVMCGGMYVLRKRYNSGFLGSFFL